MELGSELLANRANSSRVGGRRACKRLKSRLFHDPRLRESSLDGCPYQTHRVGPFRATLISGAGGQAPSEDVAIVGQSEHVEHMLPPEILHELACANAFPDPRRAPADGLLGYGGDLSPERLLAAYTQGIFPWYDEAPILWFSPDPRVVLLPEDLRINRTLAKNLRRDRFEIRFDTAFGEVIEACSQAPRPGQEGTWITAEMIEAYCALHELGFAHSVEAWQADELVGGVYGISLGAAFFGESMFARRSDASKVAFVHLVRHIQAQGCHFLDCQAATSHTTRLGAVPWPREAFLEKLECALSLPTRYGPWSPIEDPSDTDALAGEAVEQRENTDE